MALAHLPNILPHTPVAILGDNLDVVQAVNRAISNSPPARPSTYVQRTPDTAYTSLLAPLPHQIHQAWIKGHTHLMKNELADYFLKCAEQALTWHPSLLPPPLWGGSPAEAWSSFQKYQNTTPAHPSRPGIQG